MRHSGRGFTLVELLFYVSLIGMTVTSAAPNCIQAGVKAKEAEVKSSCHTIQIALERYATDHSGKYPKQIYGGDGDGWLIKSAYSESRGCMSVANPPKPTMDPLLYFGYMTSYPDNAFIKPGKGGKTTILMTGGTEELGYGDPRFGYTGEIMGNCLSDPRYLWEGPNELSPEQYMIYDWQGTRDKNIAMIHPDAMINPFYSMGGLPKPGAKDGKTFTSHWPGQFAYRSGGDIFISNKETLGGGGYEYIWDFPYSRINRYLLCGYGARTTQGIDVIRLTDADGDIANNTKGYIDDVYITHEEFHLNGNPIFEIKMSTPEASGGGGFGTPPRFPYWTEYNREWLYGAPDGYKDGIIITLISGSDSHRFE